MFTCSLFKPIIKVFLHSKLLCSSNLSVIREETKSEKENKWTDRRFGIVLRLGINFNGSWPGLSCHFVKGFFKSSLWIKKSCDVTWEPHNEKHLYSISITLFVKIVVSFANAALQFSSACTANKVGVGRSIQHLCYEQITAWFVTIIFLTGFMLLLS